MKSFNENYIERQQGLSSLVVNVPYKINGFDTAPKISKLLTFPFGIRIDSQLLFKSVFKLVFSMNILMTVACVLTTCVYLPLKYQNVQMNKDIKSLTNKQFALQAEVQNTSTYNRLFSSADNLKFEDSQEIVHVRNNDYPITQAKSAVVFNRYPEIHFSGF